jgi:hypothetical protein
MKTTLAIFLTLITFAVSDRDSTTKSVHNRTTELFYKTLQETIASRSNFKVFVKRVDCIHDELKKGQAIEKVNKDFYQFSLFNDTHVFDSFDGDEIMKQLESEIDSANINCIIPGAISLVLVVIVLAGIMSCMVCLTRGDRPVKV